MSITELNSTARDLMSVRAMIEELQAEEEALTDKLKAAMADQGTEVLQGDGWKPSWKSSKATHPTSTRPTARPPRPPALFSAYEKGPYPVPPTKADRVEAATKTTGAWCS